MTEETTANAIQALVEAGPDAVKLAVSLPDYVKTQEDFLHWCQNEAGVDAQMMQKVEIGSVWTHQSQGYERKVVPPGDYAPGVVVKPSEILVLNMNTGRTFIFERTSLLKNFDFDRMESDAPPF